LWTMEPVYVPKSPHEKAMQRALIQYRNPKNYELVEEALKLAHREDLIGFEKKCLIRPRNTRRQPENGERTGQQKKTGPVAGGSMYKKNATQKPDKGTRPQKKKTIRNVHKKK